MKGTLCRYNRGVYCRLNGEELIGTTGYLKLYTWWRIHRCHCEWAVLYLGI